MYSYKSRLTNRNDYRWEFCLSVCWSVCLSVCLSVCQTRDLWQYGRKIGPDFYIIPKDHL